MFIIIRINFNKEWYRLMTYIKSKSSILKLLASITITLFCIVLFPSAVKAEDNQAAEVNADITLSNQGSISRMTDGSYNTKTTFSSGDTITITSSEKMYSLYIKWDLIPSEWTLSYNGKTETNGTNGFLHEYVQIPDGTTEMTITFASKESICDMHVLRKQECQHYRMESSMSEHLQAQNPWNIHAYHR